jgi:anti-sigma regulatory factor (Ser/Thr protein kinase)
LLLVTELVTNCVRHALIAADDPLRLRGRLSAATLRLEVWDSGTEGTVARRSGERDGDIGGYGSNSWIGCPAPGGRARRRGHLGLA